MSNKPAFLQDDMPQVAVPFPYVTVAGSKPLGSGTYYYIMAFGKLNEGQDVWKNEGWNDYAPIPKMYCQFWMDEMENPSNPGNKYVRWLYTGKNDPVHVLGLDTRKQDPERLKQIYKDKASKYPIAQPEREFILPVFKVNKVGKGYDIANGEAQLLIIRKNTLDLVIEKAKAFVDEDDPSIFGRALILDKNLNHEDPKQIYKFTIPTGKPIDLSNKLDEIQQMRDKAFADIDRVFAEANGNAYGNTGSENVWGYLTTHFGGTREQLIARYSVKSSNGNMVFDSIEEVEI